MNRRLSKVALNLTAVGVFIFFAFPVYWMVATAFKPRRDIFTFDISLWPRSLTLDNFRTAFNKDLFWVWARNSLIVALCTVALSAVVALLAATAVSRYRWRGRTTYLVMLLIVQMIPLEALIIPLYVVMRQAGLLNQLPALILTYMAFVLPFTIWTLRGFVGAVPVELEEAALVDGCTRFKAFWKIVFPLVAPGLVATGVFAFIQAWNEFILALVLMQEQSHYTLPVFLGTFKTAQGTDWGGLMAGSTIFAIPVIVFFLIVQRRMVSGLTAGAVKG